MKLLLIEDEIRMAQALCEIFNRENYEVDHFDNGIEGCIALEADIYDIAVVDVMLPGMNGYDVVKSVRSKGIKTPILILTAKSELDDKVMGLDSGADDYLTKPFMIKELLARIRALGRRSTNSFNDTLEFGDISLDSKTLNLKCLINNQIVRLSEKEYRILEYLISNSNRVLTREQLAVKIWGYDNDSEYNNVEVYMSFTRKKLTFIGAKTEIKAIRGIGYQLRCENV